ncbi:FKBP-type peptidyl-prolyl cis-trans isomerase [Marinomonas transparens]|uniref:Peptidyl-prolyl cis-trans isomerase n=1 Tax=Marinomonas transparens TaxID=2795388 RepID=A0A934JZD2_9GAMM|nr:peptidylprolyl isomerase [Marinomonas transparens]MBJ7539682.1 peptidylprolyl isomerase [Marinomonas transparens]
MQIAENTVVSMHYTLTDEQGETLDSSIGQDPLVFLSGAQNIIDGLDKALQGKKSGEKLTVAVSPEEGYGEIHQELIQKVPRENFQGVDDIQVGMQFMAQTPDGQQPVTVIEVEEDGVMLDGNHPLAGKMLNFDVEVLEVREASAEELEHGHVHGEGGHQH